MVSVSGIFHHIVGGIARDRVARILWLTAAGINVVTWGATRFAQSSDSFVPLHYTIYFGIDLTGPSTRLYWLPAAGTAMLILHSFGAAAVTNETWRRSWLLTVVTLEIILGLALAAVLTWAGIRL